MHPRLFELFGFTLHSYGLILAIAFLVAIWIVVRGARREDIAEERIFDLSVYAVISALVGAKALLIFADLGFYWSNPREILSTLRSGGVFYGGFVAAAFVTYWYMRKHSLPAWKIADLIAPGIALAQSIGRLGCFSAGCCYGSPTDRPWAVVFHDAYAYETVGTPIGIPLHPTQLYESLGTLGIFLLLVFARRWKRVDGQIFWLYAALYAVLRFILEFFRGDPRGVWWGRVSTSQLVAILVLPVALWMLVRLSSRAKAASSPTS